MCVYIYIYVHTYIEYIYMYILCANMQHHKHISIFYVPI